MRFLEVVWEDVFICDLTTPSKIVGIKTNSHKFQDNGVHRWEYQCYNGVYCFWRSLDTGKDQEMFCLFGTLCGFVSLLTDLKDLWSASIGTMPNPSPWLNENYFFSSTSSYTPSAIHLIPLICQDWKMNFDEFSLKYDNPRWKPSINTVGFLLGWCWVTKDSFINVFISYDNWRGKLGLQKDCVLYKWIKLWSNIA